MGHMYIISKEKSLMKKMMRMRNLKKSNRQKKRELNSQKTRRHLTTIKIVLYRDHRHVLEIHPSRIVRALTLDRLRRQVIRTNLSSPNLGLNLLKLLKKFRQLLILIISLRLRRPRISIQVIIYRLLFIYFLIGYSKKIYCLYLKKIRPALNFLTGCYISKALIIPPISYTQIHLNTA